MPEPATTPDAPEAPLPLTGHDPYAVLRNRDFVLYLVGRLVASVGQQMLTVAVGWELYERTHSALALGLVGLTQMLPMLLFTLPAGHVADNFDRKRIIVLMNLVIACASVGLTIISALGAEVFWIYGCLFAAGTARTFLWPASSAFLPHLVSRPLFSRAVAWSSGSFQLSSVAGPAAGGALIALSRHAAPVYAVNAAAHLIAALTKALAEGRLEEKLKLYTTPRLLIIDEIGYLPIDRTGANLFFQLISRRYERGPMILTSNQSFGAWGEVFGDRVIATAILDRLLHHAVTLNIRGNSYRLKEKLKAGLVRSFDDEAQPQPGGEI